MPHAALYHEDLWPLLRGRGAAWLNRLSVRALGFPAPLITLPHERRVLLDAAAKETTSDGDDQSPA